MADRLFRQLVSWARTARRRTILGPLLDAWALRTVLASMEGDPRELRVLGPEEFSPYLRCLTPLGGHMEDIPGRPFDWVIVKQDRLAGLPIPLIRLLHEAYRCTASNRRYLLFRRSATRPSSGPDLQVRQRLESLLESAPSDDANPIAVSRWDDRAVLVTTFDRPAALERSLPQIARLGAPVLLVDDGSGRIAAERNRELALTHGVEYLRLPSNRGISAALNTGLEYLLADERLKWISYFQDDVDVRQDALTELHRLEDAHQRPLLTGYDADEHPALEETDMAGLAVRLKRETAGVHLHAHRDYWRSVLPIPSEYLGAPKRRWDASLEDAWITVGAPGSVAKQGLPVVCLPGLVRTFLWHGGDSTWGNPNDPEADLPPG